MSSDHLCRKQVLGFFLPGHMPPSKKNSKFVVHTKRGSFPISSKTYRKWNAAARSTLHNIFGEMLPILKGGNLGVRLIFYPQDKRKFDLTNKAESIMDLMVEVGMLADDNYSIAPTVTLIYGGLSKIKPGVRVEIFRCQQTETGEEQNCPVCPLQGTCRQAV